MEVFLYPVITIEAEDEADAIDQVIKAICTAGVGEIPGWCSPPPSFEEKRLQQAAPERLAALIAAPDLPDDFWWGNRDAVEAFESAYRARCTQHDAAIAKAEGI